MKDDKTYALDVLDYARRAKRHVEGQTAGDFAKEEWLQDAVLRCFEVMGEAAKRVRPEFRAAHPQIPWKQIAGFRDVLIHGYDGINYERCWKIIEEDLPRVIAELERIIPPER